MADKWRDFRRAVQRKRKFHDAEASDLKRCLNYWDLTALGLGSMLGVGIYVIVGAVAAKIAGPAIVLSFLVAAVATFFAGLCYAELGAKVPRAGTAYIYTYVTVGELVAFIVGWNMVLEMLFGTASVAKGLSLYIDSLAGNEMSAWFKSFGPLSDGTFFSTYFDFFAFGIVIVLGLLLAFGVGESAIVNNIFTVINISVILFIIIAGAINANPANWNIQEFSLATGISFDRQDPGVGGFFPYGVMGMLKGAAVCFYGFVGFDAISATSEEVKNPRRTIPIAILITLALAFLLYGGVATVVTLMVPYYALERIGAVAKAFSYIGWDWARWTVGIGAVFGICSSLFGSMFTLPRLLYSMAADGMLVHWLARVSKKRQSPIVATLFATVIVGILGAVMELEQLVLMICVGTLLSYTLVTICVIKLRYESNTHAKNISYVKQMFGCGQRTQSQATARIVNISMFLYILTCIVIASVAIYSSAPWFVALLLNLVALVLLIIMTVQPQAPPEKDRFRTPLVPIIPCLSIYINIHLMILINFQTWIRIGIWAALGIPIYLICLCCYKKKEENFEDYVPSNAHKGLNGKANVQIVIESPTPPSTLKTNSSEAEDTITKKKVEEALQMREITNYGPVTTDESIEHEQVVIENIEEKEAKIIGLLDEVLQAEEDNYEEIASLKESKVNDDEDICDESIPHRKSLSELSDAGSDASFGNQVLSKYDVIAQVHREDLPKVSEEEEKIDKKEILEETINVVEPIEEVKLEEVDEVTELDDDISETNSRTDESGYSDTLDRNDSTDEIKENIPYIPPPPPLDENYFANSYFKKSYSTPPGPVKLKPVEIEEETSPRPSVQSSGSQDDSTIVFGSDRQMNFMSKLSVIYQTKKTPETEELKRKNPENEEQRRRSNSTGDVVNSESVAMNRQRPSFLPPDLMNDIKALSSNSAPNLRPVNIEDPKEEEDNTGVDSSMSRQDLRSKLEDMFATGGPKPFKPRAMKSNPPTPEEAYQTDSSSESIQKLPKVDKNDTLKRQKDKFSAVLNSFRLSFNKDDEV